MTDDSQIELLLADDISKFYADPYGFVMYCFDWGEGELAGFDQPDEWQRDLLQSVGEGVVARGFDGVSAVDPLRYAVASGHG